MNKIINHFSEWLSRPYSYREEFNFQITIPFIVGFIVFLVLYLLKPFGLAEVQNNHLIYFGGYGLLTSIIILLFFFLIAPIFPNFFSDANWTVKREILTLSSIIFLIGIFAWLYHQIVASSYNSDKFTLLYFLRYTFSIGVFPVILYVYLSEMLLTSDRKNVAKTVREKVAKRKKKNIKEITLIATNKKNELVFNLDNLIYIVSEGNYANIYLKDEENIIHENVLRIQLKVIESELKAYENIVRCHKSYIVNTNYVKDISGNARGHFLHLSVDASLIPVSRKYTRTELEKLVE